MTNPPVQVLGPAVLLQNPALSDVLHLAVLGAKARTRHDGYTIPTATRDALKAMHRAANSHSALTEDLDPIETITSPVGSADAAVILECSTRQAQRIMRLVGGRKVAGRMMADRGAIESEAAARRARA